MSCPAFQLHEWTAPLAGQMERCRPVHVAQDACGGEEQVSVLLAAIDPDPAELVVLDPHRQILVSTRLPAW
jgi:hypothetical protein